MHRLVYLALVAALVSCSSFTDKNGLYREDQILLEDRSYELYFDANNSRRRRTICHYNDGSTLTVERGYNYCPPVFPQED